MTKTKQAFTKAVSKGDTHYTATSVTALATGFGLIGLGAWTYLTMSAQFTPYIGGFAEILAFVGTFGMMGMAATYVALPLIATVAVAETGRNIYRNRQAKSTLA